MFFSTSNTFILIFLNEKLRGVLSPSFPVVSAFLTYTSMHNYLLHLYCHSLALFFCIYILTGVERGVKWLLPFSLLGKQQWE